MQKYNTKKNHSNKRVVPEKLSPTICSNNHCIYSRFTSCMCDIVYKTQPNLQLFKYKIVCIKFSFSIRFSYEKINVKIYTKRRVFSAFFSTLKHRMLTTCYLVHRENLNWTGGTWGILFKFHVLLNEFYLNNTSFWGLCVCFLILIS